MKKFAVLLLAGTLLAGPAFADAVDDGLPAGADQGIKAHTRTMIQAGVAAEDGLDMTRAMLQNQYQNQEIIQAQESVMQAARQGLPTDPVMNKAHEGIAKNVSPANVVQAMQQVQARYAKAFQQASELTIDAPARNQLGQLMAEAMTAGLSEESTARIMQQLRAHVRTSNQTEDSQLAIQTGLTTRTMARMGVDADTTAEVVCLALQNQSQTREMAQLQQQFQIRTQMEPQQLAHQMMQNMRNGSNGDSQGRQGQTFGQGNGGNGEGSGSGADGSGSGYGGDAGSGAAGGGSGSGSGGSGSGGASGDGSGGSGSGSGGGSGGSSDGSGSGSGSGGSGGSSDGSGSGSGSGGSGSGSGGR